jgi:carbamoyl-phosphate synthase large subunit
MKQLNILVTGVGGGGLGEQLIKALRLSTISCKIFGGDITPLSKGLCDVDVPCILPSAGSENYISEVLKLCNDNKIHALFYGSEAELLKLSSHRQLFEDAGVFLPLNPASVIEICLDKNKTVEFLKLNGYKYPKSNKVIKGSFNHHGISDFPVVIKPSIGGGGSANIFIAQNEIELKVYCDFMFTIYNEFIIQEYVGKAEDEFTVGILFTLNGELVNAIAIRRNILSSLSSKLKVPNRSGKAQLGPILAISNGISQGEIGRFPEVTDKCIEIAKSLGSTASINIQCRLVGDEVYVFEINPRFSGTSSLRALVGYNEPEVLIRHHLLNENINPFFEYRSGFVLRGLQEAFIPS